MNSQRSAPSWRYCVTRSSERAPFSRRMSISRTSASASSTELRLSGITCARRLSLSARSDGIASTSHGTRPGEYQSPAAAHERLNRSSRRRAYRLHVGHYDRAVLHLADLERLAALCTLAGQQRLAYVVEVDRAGYEPLGQIGKVPVHLVAHGGGSARWGPSAASNSRTGCTTPNAHYGLGRAS